MFARLKDFRRVATRYDKLARNTGGYDHLVDLIESRP
jgi:transposase